MEKPKQLTKEEKERLKIEREKQIPKIVKK